MYNDDQIKRSVYYAAVLTHNALSAGEQYAILPHIYQIMFMDFTVTEDKRHHHTYTFKERTDHTELSDIVQIHHVELPKISESLKKPAQELSELEFWSILILSAENEKAAKLLKKLSAHKEEIGMAESLLNTMSQDQQEWEKQFGYERFVHDCISREKYAYTQGIEQGISQGIAQGEHKRALEAARRMLRNGKLSAEEIAEISQLTLDEILRLQ